MLSLANMHRRPGISRDVDENFFLRLVSFAVLRSSLNCNRSVEQTDDVETKYQVHTLCRRLEPREPRMVFEERRDWAGREIRRHQTNTTILV